ncbi:unnamed protein product [Paramecium sonneborni]|uniref:Uncharacterized protein n=1 Tax=Paramecium sonneborni TaxID=65129 RepID=A0A8S1K0Z1_9CILI|nr:unnamed protein product [Paramecium sonneborni]
MVKYLWKIKMKKLIFNNLINLSNNEKVTIFYKPNKHWVAKFQGLSDAYEDFRINNYLVSGKTKREKMKLLKLLVLILLGCFNIYLVEQLKLEKLHILLLILMIYHKKDISFLNYSSVQINQFTVKVDYNKIWNIGKDNIVYLLKKIYQFINQLLMMIIK